MNTAMSQRLNNADSSLQNTIDTPLTDEVARLRTLDQCHILDTAPEKTFDELTTLAAYICQTPIAYISLVDAQRLWFKSKVGIATTETPRQSSFCTYTVNQSDVFIIPDTLADERFATNSMVSSEPFIRFYAGVPLITVEGHHLGALCILDYVPRELTLAQVDALQKLAYQVVQLIELRRNLGNLEKPKTQHKKIEKQGKYFLRNVAAGFGVASLVLLIVGTISYRNLNRLIRHSYSSNKLP